jgi:deoxyribodipyrimidine photo-lyase
MSTRALVWFKRDLRVQDHAPLRAAADCDEVAALYVFETAWLEGPETDAQHVQFALDGVHALAPSLAALNVPLLVQRGSMVDVLTSLHQHDPFTHLFSHEETGAGWSYARDIAVAAWCKALGVVWNEFAQTGVVRRLKSRTGWAGRWQRRMGEALVQPLACRAAPASSLASMVSLTSAHARHDGPFDVRALGLPAARPTPKATEAAAHDTLQSFLQARGRHYRQDLSSPLNAETGNSRLSAYLSFGMLSMRQVHLATEARLRDLKQDGSDDARSFAYHLRGFAGRLRWHCHFMQKLEDEPAIEFHNFARYADGLRENDFDRERFEAWREGRTGYPMVDACMRQLNTTGWINFRMRAMLVSFASYHLWLHWRETGQHLARQFLDFEPGIHWSQMQMQSGTTGINTVRMYSPLKQATDHDPHGVYARQWIKELGTAAYPGPIVDGKQAVKQAKDRIFAQRKTDHARQEAQAIQAKHGSRKSGLPPSPKPRREAASRARAAPPNDMQGSLDFDSDNPAS